VDGFIERDDLMSSVAFWYQTEPHKKWAALPPGADRLPFRETNLVVGWRAVETAQHSSHPFEVQNLGGVTDGKQLWLRPADATGWVEIAFKVEAEQTVELWGKMVHSHDYGIYRVKLDGKELARMDLYDPNVVPTPHKWGVRTLTAGAHTLRLECVGKSPNSGGYLLGFDALSARVPVYSRPASVDLRTLQKAQ